MQTSRLTLADSWDCGAATANPSASALKDARHILHCAALPATVDAINSRSKFGRQRLLACLAVMEARGEVILNKRGDAVFALVDPTNPSRPGSTATATHEDTTCLH